jgi:hypothetical protein
MTEHSDAIDAAQQILNETNPEEEQRFEVTLPRRIVRKLSGRFGIVQSLGDIVAVDLENDRDLPEKENDIWQKLVQGRHDDMRAILGKRFIEASEGRNSKGFVRVSLSYREVDFLGRSRMEILSEEFEETDPVDEMVLKGRRLTGFGTREEEVKDFLGINRAFIEAGGRDNTELRTFYEKLLENS